MFDSLTAARQLTEAGFDRKHADAMANVIRQATQHGDHVTSEQFTAGLNSLRAEIAASEFRLTWRFAGAMLAQTAATVGAVVAILRLLG